MPLQDSKTRYPTTKLSNKEITKERMFERWKYSVKTQMRIDHKTGKEKKIEQWHKIHCQWYTFKPGEDGEKGSLLFSDEK
ncbi:hypothetical protein BB559_001008 [Furculomyces boomerangus]|uniref:Uncharacterized protein n=1 Tax=Furculomyces boomerangus TaxID=61424 RepID=A0A2T9Z3H5_9FUNG|nr:hypothetical protein BB559_001008 [Furculomyces boomerangus]